jgi:hypothetical protein
MERLTEKERNKDGTAISKKSLVIEEGMKKGFPSAHCSAIVTKLADYEDLEEQGLIWRVPCKVGTMLYTFNGKIVSQLKVVSFYPENDKLMTVLELLDGGQFSSYILPEHIGKYYFLTEEEAKLNGKDNA